MNNDLISRSELVRFGYTHLVRVISRDNELGTKRLSEIPAVDAVPVVRCRDCMYATWAIWAQRYNCEKVRGLMTADNHFCAWGKRREDK